MHKYEDFINNTENGNFINYNAKEISATKLLNVNTKNEAITVAVQGGNHQGVVT